MSGAVASLVLLIQIGPAWPTLVAVGITTL